MKNIADVAETAIEAVVDVAEESSSLITPKRILAVGGVALLVGGSIWAYRTLKKRAAQIEAEVVEEVVAEQEKTETAKSKTTKP